MVTSKLNSCKKTQREIYTAVSLKVNELENSFLKNNGLSNTKVFRLGMQQLGYKDTRGK